MGIRVGALAVIVVSVLVANAPAGSAGAGQASVTSGDETTTVTYSGTLNSTVQLVADNSQVNETLTQDISWQATWTGPTNMISSSSGETLAWTSVTLSGSDSIQYRDTGSPNPPQNCADSLSAAPGQTFNAVLPFGGDSITFALNAPQPSKTATAGGGCFMSPRLACPPGTPPNEPAAASYCSPAPAWKFKDGSKTFNISSNYGPTNVGGKVVTSDLSSTVSVSGAGCALSSSPAGKAAERAHAADQKIDVLAYEREGRSVREIANLTDKPYNGTIDAVVGQLLILRVDCSKPLKPAPGPYSWTVPGLGSDLRRTSAIASYTVNSSVTPAGNSAVVDQSVDTHSQTLTLEFIRSGTFELTAGTGAGQGHLSVHVVVPDLIDAKRTYSFCDINTANRSFLSPHLVRTSPPTLSAGLNDQCRDRPGVAWDWRVLLPDLKKGLRLGAGGGRIAMAQLFAKVVRADGKDCVQVANLDDVSSWPADDASFYGFRPRPSEPRTSDRWMKEGAAGRSLRLQNSDSPMIPLQHENKVYELVFRARDYLMYQSQVPGSAWIPIAEQTWRYAGQAHFRLRPGKGNGRTIHGVWRLVNGSSVNPTGPNGAFFGGVIAPLPEWSQAAVATGLSPDC